jgi:hypothetical protein
LSPHAFKRSAASSRIVVRTTRPFVVCFFGDAIANEPPGLIVQSKKKCIDNRIYKFGRTSASIYKIVYSGSDITTNHYQFMDTKLPLLNKRNVSIRENANERVKIVDREMGKYGLMDCGRGMEFVAFLEKLAQSL